MNLKTMKDQATDDVRAISRSAGIEFTSLQLVVSSCNTDGSGNSWRAEAVGVYKGPATVDGSQELIDGWVKRLAPSGWKVSGYGAASQTPLTNGDIGITLTQNNPKAARPDKPNFVYDGPCHSLSDSDQDSVRTGDGGTQDILAVVR